MRNTRTNSGRDSKGVVRLGGWELEGRTYLFIVGGAVGSVLLFLLCFHVMLLLRVPLALLPLLMACLWVKAFVLGRPPHYMEDRFSGWLGGHDFNISVRSFSSRVHPRCEASERRGL